MLLRILCKIITALAVSSQDILFSADMQQQEMES